MLEKKLNESFNTCSKAVRDHCRRTGDLVRELLAVLEWQEFEEIWCWRGKLPFYYHDIGKAMCSDENMKEHPEKGGTFFSELYRQASEDEKDEQSIIFFSIASDACLYHHEWLNGFGYPAGRKKQEIVLVGRLCAVADTWDNLTHETPGRPALAEAAAKEIMEGKRNIQFDDYLVKALFQINGFMTEKVEDDIIASPITRKRHFWSLK